MAAIFSNLQGIFITLEILIFEYGLLFCPLVELCVYKSKFTSLMRFGIDTSRLSLRNMSVHDYEIQSKLFAFLKMFLCNNQFLLLFFCSFILNRCYGNQWALFPGNLQGLLIILEIFNF